MGKTREQTQKIDPALEAASKRNLQRAEAAAKIPFVPNRGITVAGFTPQEVGAFNMANDAATAFGFDDVGPYTPPAGETVGGIYGHSAAGLYDDMKAKSVPLGLQNYIDQFFVNPVTGTGGNMGAGAGSGSPVPVQNRRSAWENADWQRDAPAPDAAYGEGGAPVAGSGDIVNDWGAFKGAIGHDLRGAKDDLMGSISGGEGGEGGGK